MEFVLSIWEQDTHDLASRMVLLSGWRTVISMDHATTIKLFEHCRLIVGMVMSLAVARLLNGLARFVQHPKKMKVYGVHLAWVFTMLILLTHFWWWEFKLIDLQVWTYGAYFLIILYAIVFFILCSLLFPDSMEEYSGFEDYFMSRRRWFFGIFGLSFLIDLLDTWLKGVAHFQSLGLEYPIRNILYLVLCVVAMFVTSQRFHVALVAISLVYEVSYILRLFNTQ